MYLRCLQYDYMMIILRKYVVTPETADKIYRMIIVHKRMKIGEIADIISEIIDKILRKILNHLRIKMLNNFHYGTFCTVNKPFSIKNLVMPEIAKKKLSYGNEQSSYENYTYN